MILLGHLKKLVNLCTKFVEVTLVFTAFKKILNLYFYFVKVTK